MGIDTWTQDMAQPVDIPPASGIEPTMECVCHLSGLHNSATVRNTRVRVHICFIAIMVSVHAIFFTATWRWSSDTWAVLSSGGQHLLCFVWMLDYHSWILQMNLSTYGNGDGTQERSAYAGVHLMFAAIHNSSCSVDVNSSFHFKNEKLIQK